MNELTMGQRIAQERKKSGISQEALGEKMGVSRQAISKWEADGAVPEIDKLIALSRLFGVSVGWLLGVEEQPQARADELSEAQLKMVEEIVKRYQPQNADQKPKQPWYIPVLCCIIAIVGLICIAVMTISSYSPSAPGTDYAQQISSLQSNYSSIQGQLSSLDSRLNELTNAAEAAEKPLTNFGFELTAVEKNARITFNGIPKSHKDNQSAILRVSRGNGEVFHQYTCQWDGLNWTCDMELPIEDGYEFCFLLTKNGETQIQLLEAYELADLATNSTLNSGSELVGLEYDPDTWKLEIHRLYFWAAKPVFGSGADQSWAELALELYRNGEPLELRSFIEDYNEHGRSEPTISIDITSILFRYIKLEEGDTLEIRFRAALGNDAETESTVGIWQYSGGKLTQVTE